MTGARLVGAFTEVDWRSTTAAFDAVYVRGGEIESALGPMRVLDGLHAGVSFAGRPGSGAFNAAVRLLMSTAAGGGVPAAGALGIGDPAGGDAGVLGAVVDAPP